MKTINISLISDNTFKSAISNASEIELKNIRLLSGHRISRDNNIFSGNNIDLPKFQQVLKIRKFKYNIKDETNI